MGLPGTVLTRFLSGLDFLISEGFNENQAPICQGVKIDQGAVAYKSPENSLPTLGCQVSVEISSGHHTGVGVCVNLNEAA